MPSLPSLGTLWHLSASFLLSLKLWAKLGSLVGSSHTRERNGPSSALSTWFQAGGSEKHWVSWPAALKLSVSPWVGFGLQSCPGTAPAPPSPLSHVNITIWSLNMSLGLRECAETLQGLERPHICCPGTEKMFILHQALLLTSPLAITALGALPGVELPYRNEKCAGPCHHGRERDVPLLMLAEAPAGTWSLLQGWMGEWGHVLWPSGYFTFLCKS